MAKRKWTTKAKLPPSYFTKVERLSQLFGGQNAFARELQLSAAAVSRWRHFGVVGQPPGEVPIAYNGLITEAADRLGISREKVAECLQPTICPMCGCDAGTSITPRHRMRGGAEVQ